MRLVASILLLVLGHGALAQDPCARNPPPHPENRQFRLAYDEFDVRVIDGFDVRVQFAPPSPGTKAGVMRVDNRATTRRWIKVYETNEDLPNTFFQLEPLATCKTNVEIGGLHAVMIFFP